MSTRKFHPRVILLIAVGIAAPAFGAEPPNYDPSGVEVKTVPGKTQVEDTGQPQDPSGQDISNQLDLPLLIDKKSLEDLMIDLKKGVSLQAKGLSARTVLRSILGAQGLTFVVKDETIQIVTVERSKSLLTTRVYYLGDLVKGVGPFSGIEWGPVANLQQSQANVAAIIDAVKKIDPLSWSGMDTGGPGSVTFHTPTMSLIVRNSAEVHYSLGRSLGHELLFQKAI